MGQGREAETELMLKLGWRNTELDGGKPQICNTFLKPNSEPGPKPRQVRQVRRIRRVAGAGYRERNKRIVEPPSPTRTS